MTPARELFTKSNAMTNAHKLPAERADVLGALETQNEFARVAGSAQFLGLAYDATTACAQRDDNDEAVLKF